MAKRIKLQDRTGVQLLPLTRSELVQVSQITGLDLLNEKTWQAATVQDVLEKLSAYVSTINQAQANDNAALTALNQKLQSFSNAVDSVKNYVDEQNTSYNALAYAQSAADAAAAQANSYAYAATQAAGALAEVDVTVAAGNGNVLTGFEIEDGKLKANSITTTALTSSNVARTATTGDHGVAATDVESAIVELSTKIDTSYTNAEAYTDEKVNGLKGTLNGTITAESGKVFTSITQTNGVLSYTDAALTASDITRTATTKVGGTTVEAALANLADAIDTGGTGSVVSVEEVTTGLGDNVLKAYKIWQGPTSEPSNLKGTINIPKDLVVTSGQVITATAEDTGCTVGEKYLKLTIANQTSPVYIAVADLVDVYTTNNQTSEITVAVDGNNNITASVGTIAASKISYTGGTTVQAELESLNAKVDTASTNLNSNIYTYNHANLNADLDATGTAAHSGTFVMSGVTQTDGKLVSVDSIEVEAAGAAAAVKTTIDDYTVNSKKISTNPVLYAGDIAMSSSDATTTYAAISALQTADGNSVKTVNGQSPTNGAVTVNANQIDTVNQYKIGSDASATTHKVDEVLAAAVLYVAENGTYDDTTI